MKKLIIATLFVLFASSMVYGTEVKVKVNSNKPSTKVELKIPRPFKNWRERRQNKGLPTILPARVEVKVDGVV